MTTKHDPTTWVDRHRDLCDELRIQPGGDDLANLIVTYTNTQMRRTVATSDGPPLELLSADEILTTDWPEPTWAIPELLPVGLTIMAGKPKVGKSWLALQIAQAVAAGGRALDQQVESGPVMYMALEDPPRRLKDRMEKQKWPLGLHCDFMQIGRFFDEVGDLRNGGGDVLARQIKHKGYRLVIIDTFSRSCQADENDKAAMTIALDPIHQIAHSHNTAVLLIDHHHKMASGDVIIDILGSTAKGAMCDTAWGLYHQRGKSGAELAVRGRDVIDKTLALMMDRLTCAWQVEGDAFALKITEKRQELLDILADIGPATLKEIGELTDRPKGAIYKDLQELIKDNKVVSTGERKDRRYDIAKVEFWGN